MSIGVQRLKSARPRDDNDDDDFDHRTQSRVLVAKRHPVPEYVPISFLEREAKESGTSEAYRRALEAHKRFAEKRGKTRAVSQRNATESDPTPVLRRRVAPRDDDADDVNDDDVGDSNDDVSDSDDDVGDSDDNVSDSDDDPEGLINEINAMNIDDNDDDDDDDDYIYDDYTDGDHADGEHKRARSPTAPAKRADNRWWRH